MSTAVFLSHPAQGHINPTLPVVSELVRRGERIIYYATEPFRAKVEATGVEYRSFGPQELFERQLAYGGIFGGMAGLIETTEEILPDLLRELRDDLPDYLLLEAHSVLGNLVQKILKLPAAITLCAMFAFNEQLISPAELTRFMYGQAPAQVVLDGLLGLHHYVDVAQRVSQRYGVSCPNMIEYLSNLQPLNIVFTSREFQVGGDVFDDRYKFVGPSIMSDSSSSKGGNGAISEASDFPFDQLGSKPLIYISMGTMYNDAVEFYHACFDAFCDSSYQVIMSIGQRIDPQSLRTEPANFIVRPFVPQLEVLKHATLFVTHGGMNSVTEGIWYEVPMIVLPQQADHYVVANRVADVGAGLVLDRSQVTPEKLRTMTQQILDEPSFQQSCVRIGGSFREAGGYRKAADEILAFKP